MTKRCCKNRIYDIINPQGVSDMDYPTIEDIEILNLLRRAELGIQNIYQELGKLELSKGISHTKYQKKLKQLKQLILLEDNLFEEKQDYFMYIYEILEEIINQVGEVSPLMVTTDSNLANIRIYDKASYIFDRVIGGTEAYYVRQNLRINKKLFLFICSLFTNQIAKTTDSQLKKKLITIKYNNIYVSDSIEEKLLNRDMENLSSEKYFMKLKKEEKNPYFNQLISAMYNHNFDLLFHIPIEDISSEATVLYIMSHIKATLFFLPDSVTNALYASLKQKSEESCQLHLNNSQTLNYALKIFEETKEERKHYQK